MTAQRLADQKRVITKFNRTPRERRIITEEYRTSLRNNHIQIGTNKIHLKREIEAKI